jgi:hypothetical protein
MSKVAEGTLSKVPAVTLAFWLIKILATTLGETGGDAITMTLNLGYLVGTADTHRPRPTFADGTDRTTVLPRSAHNSLGAGRDRKFSIVLSVTSRPARNRGPIGDTGHRISLVQTAQNDDASLV